MSVLVSSWSLLGACIALYCFLNCIALHCTLLDGLLHLLIAAGSLLPPAFSLFSVLCQNQHIIYDLCCTGQTRALEMIFHIVNRKLSILSPEPPAAPKMTLNGSASRCPLFPLSQNHHNCPFNLFFNPFSGCSLDMVAGRQRALLDRVRSHPAAAAAAASGSSIKFKTFPRMSICHSRGRGGAVVSRDL